MRFPHFGLTRSGNALRSGSLILAADLPEGRSAEFPLLGGGVRLDPRPFRLARATRAPCRPAFLTLPSEGWTLTVGDALPSEEEGLDRFARLFAEVAAAAPLDLDGLVYASFAREQRGRGL